MACAPRHTCCVRAGQVLARYTEMAARDGKVLLLGTQTRTRTRTPNPNANPNPNQVRGELTLVLAPLGAEAREAREAARQLSLTEQVDAALRARLAAGEPVSSTAKQVAVELGVPKKAVYARALQISKASPEAAAGGANGPEGIEGIHF